jgi:hypothetical protein
MSLFMAIPKATHDLVEVATSAALKTVLQVATPSTTNIRIVAWGISFDGIVATNPAGRVQLVDVDVAATVTALTPEEWGNADSPASLCVSGTAATGYNATAEGTIGASTILDGQNIHPQTGYAVWFPDRAGPLVKASRFLRVRCTFSVDIGSLPWILWEEPA